MMTSAEYKKCFQSMCEYYEVRAIDQVLRIVSTILRQIEVDLMCEYSRGRSDVLAEQALKRQECEDGKTMTTRHDDHYRDSNATSIIEQNMTRMIAAGIDPSTAYDVSCVIKYALRCGSKKNEPAQRDIEKMSNYAFRAANGRWPWDMEGKDNE